MSDTGFLADWVNDPRARQLLLYHGVMLVDHFEEAVLDGRLIEHVQCRSGATSPLN